MDRRDLLKTLGGAAALSALNPAAALGASPEGVSGTGSAGGALKARLASGDVPGRGRVRNVIFLAYDGTGYEDFATVDFFARKGTGRNLRFRELLAGGATGTMITSSLSSWVTDSSAASSAWATGRKIVNSQVNEYPDGTRLTTILELAQARGMKTGLVSSARITHATPAAWIAHVPLRDMEDDIAEQYLTSGVDVFMGGGAGHFDPAVRFDDRDVLSEFRAAGYDVARTAEELEGSTGSRILGVFAPGTRHMPYEIDRIYQDPTSPSLATLTRAALDRLEGAEQGFVLQVEAGRIDHANHNCDPGGMVWDWLAADDALSVILDFVDGRDDTLLIFGCDHDTGGGVTYGWGSGYRNAEPSLLTLGNIRASHEWLLREVLPRRPEAAEVRDIVRAYLGIPVDDAEAELLARVISSADLQGMRWGHRNAVGSGRQLQMAQLLSMSPSGTPDRPGISFATGNHTAGLVPVALYGAGVTPTNLGVVDNTELFYVMTEALGISHENPTMDETLARQIYWESRGGD